MGLLKGEKSEETSKEKEGGRLGGRNVGGRDLREGGDENEGGEEEEEEEEGNERKRGGG
jgi:hypothetical protein